MTQAHGRADEVERALHAAFSNGFWAYCRPANEAETQAAFHDMEEAWKHWRALPEIEMLAAVLRTSEPAGKPKREAIARVIARNVGGHFGVVAEHYAAADAILARPAIDPSPAPDLERENERLRRADDEYESLCESHQRLEAELRKRLDIIVEQDRDLAVSRSRIRELEATLERFDPSPAPGRGEEPASLAMSESERTANMAAFEAGLPFQISRWLTTIAAQCLCIRDGGDDRDDLAWCIERTLPDLANDIRAALSSDPKPSVPEELRSLSEKATAGPWVALHGPDGGWHIETEDGTVIAARNPWPYRSEESRANCRLLCEAVNHVRAQLSKPGES